MTRVAVIGCGPAGLAAAHAAAGLGCDIDIFAPKAKTPQRGPITLHKPIPGITTDQPHGYVRQLVIGGSVLDYRLKLYGDVNISINGDILEHGWHAWPVPEVYDKMWDMYNGFIIHGELTPLEAAALQDHYDLVVSTAPLPRLCLSPDKHEFTSVPIALMFRTSYPNQPDNLVIYNARSDWLWVRSSSIFGAKVTEYRPEDIQGPDLIIRKPLNTNCNCHPRILRAGRFGKWHNEAWIDGAYYETRTALVSMLRQDEWESIK